MRCGKNHRLTLHDKQTHVIGSGGFAAPQKDRPESTPRLYNMLDLARDLSSVRVHTLLPPKPDGP